jgi:hypothetical protein
LATIFRRPASLKTSELEYSLASSVLFAPVPDGTARLFDMDGEFYSIPVIGVEMLRATLECGPLAAARQIAERYGVDVGQVQTDLDAFLGELKTRGLIVRRTISPRRRRGWSLAHLFLGPALGFVACLPSRKVRVWTLLALAHGSFALFGWSRTLEAWRRWYRPGRRLPPPADPMERVREVDGVVRRAAAAHPLKVECKERALCCWVLAWAAGVPTALVVGIQLFPLQVHCWCEASPWTFGDDRERCETFQPIVRYEE